MPTGRSRAAASTTIAWWLSEGDEECAGCGHSYVSELLFHCPDCDGPTCIHCRTRYDGRMICQSCAPSRSEKAGSDKTGRSPHG